MIQRLAVVCLLATLLTPAFASANPEPTAYDTRSVSMGLTGASYMERPAALVLNPANLEGIGKLGFTLNFTGILTNQIAPVQGPNTRGESGLAFGPLPSGFIAGRIAPRVVFAAGLVIETGYGSSFDGVICLDGDQVVDGVPDADPATCTNPMPQDLNVTFFVGEATLGTSYRIHEKFWLGVALRLPFSKQVADLYQNVGAALGGFGYGRVKNDLSGVGFPSLRIGLTYKPHHKVSIGVMYRMWSKIKLTGETETSILTNPDGSAKTLYSTADWYIPHALQFGVSYKANPRLLLAWELRLQFHGAEKTGNQNQTVVATDPEGLLQPFTTVVGFGWKNVWSAKFGVEYRFKKRSDLLAFRGGLNVAQSAAVDEWAQYFTPPPGTSVTGMAGLGFYWDDRNNPEVKDKYQLDIGTLFAYSGKKIGNQYIDTEAVIPGTSETTTLCSREQVVRTGCAGQIGVFTYWASVAFTLQY